MTTVERRTFQRNPAAWLNRAEAGEEIVIESRGHVPLTIKAGKPAPPPRKQAANWEDHFTWLHRQEPADEALLGELLRRDR
jgi:antitoxin (DNA-binding transcriptional repressor) of toxin-antitoxin stability system